MQNKPLVTIAIPVFNCEKTIQKAINSVLMQSFSDFEVLVCDDGSTDRTVHLVQEFRDPRIRLLQDNVNRGIAYRLNQLIDHARGDFFVRMDGDDMMFPNRLEVQISFLQKHPEVDVVGSSAIVIDDDYHILGKRGGNMRTWKRDDLFFSTRFIHPSVTGRTEWFRRWKYCENMSGCEDMELWIRSFSDSKFVDINQPLLFYRDPLRFRLKTFLKRQIRIIKCVWRLKSYMSGFSVFVKSLLKIEVTVFSAIVLSGLGLGKIWLKRRNRPLLDKEAEFYNNSILKYTCS